MFRRFMPAVLAGFLLPSSVLANGPRASQLAPDRLYDARVLLAQDVAEPAPALDLPEQGKNPKLAMLYSLLLPGLGELYLGHQGRATAFFVVEGAIWTSYAVFQSQGSHRKDLYREFATVNAGAPERDDDEYYRIIGNFIASDGPFSANENVRRQARALFPNNPEQQAVYFEENAFTEDDAWTWTSEANLERYRDMRAKSLDAHQKADFALGAALANRIISIVDVGILGSGRGDDDEDDKASLRMNMAAGQDGPGATLVLSRPF